MTPNLFHPRAPADIAELIADFPLAWVVSQRGERPAATVLPLLAAKQRPTHRNDWMTSDAEIACPDPNCPSRLRITRLARRVFRHQDVTAVPLPQEDAP